MSKFTVQVSMACVLVLTFGSLSEAAGEKSLVDSLPVEVWEQVFSKAKLETGTLVELSESSRRLYGVTKTELFKRAEARLTKIMPEMVELKKGTFIMGPSPEEIVVESFWGYRVPVVIESDFHMAVDPVTQEQFEAIMGKERNDSKHKGPKLPVTDLTRADENEYIERLNTEVARLWARVYPGSAEAAPRFRKPTEQEWEYATTEPLKTPRPVELNGESADILPEDLSESVEITAKHMKYSRKNDELNLREYVVFGESWGKGPSAVDEVKPNSRGIRGLSGNVFEVTSTRWSEDPRQTPAHGSGFVRRGGNWRYISRGCRSADRDCVWGNSAYPDVGLRVVSESFSDL